MHQALILNPCVLPQCHDWEMHHVLSALLAENAAARDAARSPDACVLLLRMLHSLSAAEPLHVGQDVSFHKEGCGKLEENCCHSGCACHRAIGSFVQALHLQQLELRMHAVAFVAPGYLARVTQAVLHAGSRQSCCSGAGGCPDSWQCRGAARASQGGPRGLQCSSPAAGTGAAAGGRGSGYQAPGCCR